MQSSPIHIDFSEALNLCKNVFRREKSLTDKGINSFVPYLRFTENFCETKEELQEHRGFLIESNKSHIAHEDSAFNQKLHKLQEEGKKRAAESGNLWDANITVCERRFKKLFHSDYKKWLDIQRAYKAEAEHLRQEETRRFYMGNVARLIAEGGQEPTRLELYKELMGSGLETWGFARDKELSSREYLMYSKSINDSYKLCWSLDLHTFRRPFDLEPKTLRTPSLGIVETIYPLGVHFTIALLVHPITAKKQDFRLAYFTFNFFFPITHYYRHFRSLQELEALIRIYIIMYELIQPELDAALIKSLAVSA